MMSESKHAPLSELIAMVHADLESKLFAELVQGKDGVLNNMPVMLRREYCHLREPIERQLMQREEYFSTKVEDKGFNKRMVKFVCHPVLNLPKEKKHRATLDKKNVREMQRKTKKALELKADLARLASQGIFRGQCTPCPMPAINAASSGSQ